MASQVNAPNNTVIAAATLAPWRMVKSDGNYCAVSTTRTHIGITQDAGVSGKPVTIRMPCAGTAKVEAAAAIAKDATVYYDANGTVGTTATNNTAVGIALQAASGAGSIIEIMPF